MRMIAFKIQDGENSYEEFSVFKTELSDKEMIEDVYGDPDSDWGTEIKVESNQEITDEEASVLQKFRVAYDQTDN